VSAADHLTELYDERNRLALGFAAVAARLGWTVGWLDDPAEPGWPVLVVDTPEGQVSWHLPEADRFGSWFGAYPGAWDGHTTPEKYARLERVVLSGL
jgi:hypothetical protein